MKKLFSMKNSAVLILAAVVTFLTSCNEPSTISTIETNELQGVLLNELNEPIPNAVIELVQVAGGKETVQCEEIIESDTTDEDGNYNFKKVPADLSNVDLVIIHQDLQPYQVNLGEMLKGKDVKRVIIKAKYKKECCGQISIKVLSADDSSEINDVAVKLYVEKDLQRKAMTDDKGIYTFYEVCNNEYWLQFIKKGYQSAIVDNIVVKGCEENDFVNLTVYLKQNNEKDSCCAGTIKVFPKDKETAETIKGTFIKLMQNGEILQKKENAGDYVLFENVCEGEYELVLMKDGYNTQEIKVVVDCNEDKEITVEMEKKECCNGVMTVKVQDNNKEPISKAEVRLWLNGKKIKIGATNSEGIIKFTGLCEGKYGVDIMKEGYKGIEFSQEMECNDTVEIVKTLALSEQDSCCKGVVKVIVRDENKKAVEYAKVILWKNGKALKDGKTNADGYVAFDGLCEGEYGMSIKREGYKTIEFEFKLDCNEQKTFEKVITKEDSCCTAIMKLVIVNENKEAIQGARVEVYFAGKIIEDGESDSDGHWVMDGLCAPATYTVVVKKDGYQSQEFKMEYTECKTIIKTVVMKK